MSQAATGKNVRGRESRCRGGPEVGCAMFEKHQGGPHGRSGSKQRWDCGHEGRGARPWVGGLVSHYQPLSALLPSLGVGGGGRGRLQ